MYVYLIDNIKNSHEQCIISIWGIDTIDSISIVSICGVYCKHNFPHKYMGEITSYQLPGLCENYVIRFES